MLANLSTTVKKRRPGTASNTQATLRVAVGTNAPGATWVTGRPRRKPMYRKILLIIAALVGSAVVFAPSGASARGRGGRGFGWGGAAIGLGLGLGLGAGLYRGGYGYGGGYGYPAYGYGGGYPAYGYG